MGKTVSWIKAGEMEAGVSHNISLSMFCTFIQIVTRFFIPPIILKYVSIEQYGLWAYCFIFVGYFGMSVIGVTNVYVRYSAIFKVNNEVDKINRLLSTGAVSTGILSILVIFCAWFLIPYSFPILQIPQAQYHTAFVLIFGTLSVFSLELSLGFFNYLLHGLQKVGLQRMILTITHLTESASIIIFLYCGFGIFSLLYAFILRIVLSLILSGIACYKYLPGLSIRPKFFDYSMIRLFYGFGGIIQIRSMLGIVNGSMGKLLSGMFIGIQGAALFDLGEKFPLTVKAIPQTANAVFLPMSSHMHAKGNHREIRNLYEGGCRYISIITGLFMGFLAPFSLLLMTAWLGTDPKYSIAAFILTCFTIPYHMEVMTGPASAVYRSINKPSIELVYGASEIILVLAAVGTLFSLFGGNVYTINASICTMMTLAALFYLLYTNRYFGISQMEFFQKVFFPGMIPYFIATAIAGFSYKYSDIVLADRWTSLGALAASWLVYVMIAPFVIYRYVLNNGEREHLSEFYFTKARKFFSKKVTEAAPEPTLDVVTVQTIWNTVSKLHFHHR